MRVGIDLDGVCFDFRASLIRYMRSVGLDVKYDCEIPDGPWDFFNQWGMPLEEFIQVCNDGVDAGFVFRGGYRDNAPEALRKIESLGHTIHIITDRKFGATPASSENATREWLAEHDFPYDTLTFSADKTIIPTDIFVEDKLENYDALEAVGTRCYLIDRPWNYVGRDNRKRIKSIDEFAEIVDNMTYLSRVI